MTKKRTFPAWQMLLIPPDPRRKSTNLVLVTQQAKDAPLELFCLTSCSARGTTRPDANGCRHTDVVRSMLKPYWRRRATPVLSSKGTREGETG